MTIIKNPVIPGMAPDPSIICVDERYYIATSTFHWTPAIQLFESKDLANWQLVGYALNNEEVNLRGTNTPAGIWAPHLSYDPQTKRFWLAYSHMVNMAGREFNADSYAIWATDIRGPWSEPIYFTSIGFDPALFHDEDGRHYLTILEWETREGYQAPGHIVLAEIDLPSGKLLSPWHRVTQGFTTRGCAEARAMLMVWKSVAQRLFLVLMKRILLANQSLLLLQGICFLWATLMLGILKWSILIQ